MARSGILYSQVAKAAAQLAAAGANPTVDAVRAALGDTGSKSTIGPMLRQWRHGHREQATAVAAGLPADLLEAVQALHQRMEARAQARIEEVRETSARDQAQASEQLTASLAAAQVLQVERDDLAKQLEAARKNLAQIQVEQRQSERLADRLAAEKDGLNQRLADRADEVTLLAGQLAQAREQFEHYQEAVGAQRERDRQGYEARIAALAQENQQIATQQQEQLQLAAVLRAEKQNLELQLERVGAEAKGYLGEVYTLREQLAAAREMASSEHMNAEIAAEQLKEAQQEIVRMGERIAGLEEAHGRLRKRSVVQAFKTEGKLRRKA